MGISPQGVQQLFQSDFRLLRVEGGTDPGGSSSAWYWLERAEEEGRKTKDQGRRTDQGIVGPSSFAFRPFDYCPSGSATGSLSSSGAGSASRSGRTGVEGSVGDVPLRW
jgi:hypothetical protein